MLSIINLTISSTDETGRAKAIEQASATAMHVMSRTKNAHVSLSTRDYADDELIQEEPDFEALYNELRDKVHDVIQEWGESDKQYKRKMAVELVARTGVEL